VDDAPPLPKSLWISIAGSIVTFGVGGRLVDRYGWVDGLLRGLAVAMVVQVVLTIVLIDVDWARRSVVVMLCGQIGFAVLYLAGTFGLGEPGPGGVMCVAALVLLVVAVGGGVRASERTSRSRRSRSPGS
jgi:hypothetical protein